MPKIIIDQGHENYFQLDNPTLHSLSMLSVIANEAGFEVEACLGKLDPVVLQAATLVILPIPTKPYSPDELVALGNYCTTGGCLLVLQEEGGDRNWGNNLSEVTRPAGVVFGNYAWPGREVQVADKNLLEIVPGLTDGVISISFKGICDLELLPHAREVKVLALYPGRENSLHPVVVLARSEAGWIFALGDMAIFGAGGLSSQHNPHHAKGNRHLLENILNFCAQHALQRSPALPPELEKARRLEAEAEQASNPQEMARLYGEATTAYAAAVSPVGQQRCFFFAALLRQPEMQHLLTEWNLARGQEAELLEQTTFRAWMNELVRLARWGKLRQGLVLGREWRTELFFGLLFILGTLFFFLLPFNFEAGSQVLSALLQGLIGLLAIGFVGLQLSDQLQSEAAISLFLAGDHHLNEEAQRLHRDPRLLLCLLYLKYAQRVVVGPKPLEALLQGLLVEYWRRWQEPKRAKSQHRRTIQLREARLLLQTGEVFERIKLEADGKAEPDYQPHILPSLYLPFYQLNNRLRSLSLDIKKGINRRELESRVSRQLISAMGAVTFTIIFISVIFPFLDQDSVHEPVSRLLYALALSLSASIMIWLFLYIRALIRRDRF